MAKEQVVGTVQIRYHDQTRSDIVKDVLGWSYGGFAYELELGSRSTLGAFTLQTVNGRQVTIVKARVLRVTFTPTGTVPSDKPAPKGRR